MDCFAFRCVFWTREIDSAENARDLGRDDEATSERWFGVSRRVTVFAGRCVLVCSQGFSPSLLHSVQRLWPFIFLFSTVVYISPAMPLASVAAVHRVAGVVGGLLRVS